MALGVLSWCSAQLQRRVEKLKRHTNVISAWHSTLHHSNNSNNLCQWLQNYCCWMYFIMFHLSFSRLSVLQSRRGAGSEAKIHYTKDHLDHAKKKAVTISDFEKIWGMFWHLDSLMPVSLRQKGKEYNTNDPLCISSSWIMQGFLSQVVIQLSPRLFFLSQHI